MPSLGPLEILVVAVIGLIVFGPHRLPEIARSIGKALAEVRRMASEVRTEFESGMNLDEVEDEPEDESEDEDEPEDESEPPPPSDQEDH